MSDNDTSLLSVSEFRLKLLTIVLLLILSQISVVIAYLLVIVSVCTFFIAFISVYHKTVVLCTHLLITKRSLIALILQLFLSIFFSLVVVFTQNV